MALGSGTALLVALATMGCSDANDSSLYYLYPPLFSTETYLVSDEGDVVHTWTSEYEVAQSAYLQDDGSVVRMGAINDLAPDNQFVVGWGGPPVGGIVERIEPSSDVAWRISYYGDDFAPHHLALVLPSGNLLMPVWRYLSEDEAIAEGRDPDLVDSSGLWLDSVVELRVDGTDDYQVVWEWRTSDHLVQDVDPTRENYGSVADNPQLIDVNHESDFSGIATEDLMHINSVFYVEELDQVIVASYNYSGLWIIDHSTTTEEAAGHTAAAPGGAAICSIAGATRRHTTTAMRRSSTSRACTTPTGLRRRARSRCSTTPSPTALARSARATAGWW